MKKTILFLTAAIGLNCSLFAGAIELTVSYDYFRGLPDGSWNGNSGIVLSANTGTFVYDCIGVQLGGSYGNYNWDGRENQVFANTYTMQHIGMVTCGVFMEFNRFNGGLVIDQMMTRHFGIYRLNPYLAQLRFQGGYECGCNEFGLWGTTHLSTSHKKALGVPIAFRAVDQLNLFWTHEFSNCSKSTVWLGVPYSKSLFYRHKTAGQFTAGFSAKAPLTRLLTLEGSGSYMRAHSSGGVRSRNYAANLCVGLTYMFSEGCFADCTPYMEIANHANLLVDTNLNQ